MDSDFSTKFDLLNSQQSSQDIIWSSSDSSDSENVSKHVQLERTSVKKGSKKRKRGETSGIKRKNLSYLDITFSDSVKEKRFLKSNEEACVSTSRKSISPILNISQHKSHNTNTILSPILCTRSLKNTVKTSPILCSQNLTPKYAMKVKKNLFNSNSRLDLTEEINTIINSTKSEVPITKSINTVDRKHSCKENLQLVTTSSNMFNHDKKTIIENRTNIPNLKVNYNSSIDKRIKPDDRNSDDVHSLKNDFCKNTILRATDSDIHNKVISYFNNNCNTQLWSQHSISEYESTPSNSSKTSDEIDNFSLTQEQSRDSLENGPKYLEITNKSKKIKYKKDGMAYRLNSLLKKQNANISLWQHERFLALNSNFIIPAGEYTAFRIQNIKFKYGVYLLEAQDVNNEKYFILINSSLVSERQIKQDILLKLYVPFKILTLEHNIKLIVNATKFEFKEIL